MMVILFRSRLTAQAGADYQAMDERMMARAAAAPGFVDVKSYRADDGERLAVVRWRDAESLAAWAADPAHREAQRTGRERWYEWYAMEVAEVARESRFRREDADAAAGERA